MCFDIKPSVAISLNYFTFSGSFSSCLEAAKDGSVWSESIVHGHRQAPVQALLRKNEPPGICLPPHFSSNGIRTTNFSPWAIFFKSAWIMACIFFFLFISPRRMDYSPVLCPNGYCRFGHFNILDGSWLFFPSSHLRLGEKWLKQSLTIFCSINVHLQGFVPLLLGCNCLNHGRQRREREYINFVEKNLSLELGSWLRWWSISQGFELDPLNEFWASEKPCLNK